MRRLTISVDEELADAFDQLVESRMYLNRSEAFRDLVRKELRNAAVQAGGAVSCVATVSYIYDHHQRQLSNKLVQMQHDHSNVVLVSQHVHLKDNLCLEAVILRGEIDDVRKRAEEMLSQTGICHGSVNLIPITGTLT